jgi:hypothetical protein
MYCPWGIQELTDTHYRDYGQKSTVEVIPEISSYRPYGGYRGPLNLRAWNRAIDRS